MGSIGLFEVLGNRNRRQMIELLSERPRYMSELADEVGIGQKAVIDHLKVLDRAGLVGEYRGRNNRRYTFLSRSLHAVVFISPGSTSTVVRQLSGGCGERTVEEMAAEIRSLRRARENAREADREMSRRIEQLAKKLSERALMGVLNRGIRNEECPK